MDCKQAAVFLEQTIEDGRTLRITYYITRRISPHKNNKLCYGVAVTAQVKDGEEYRLTGEETSPFLTFSQDEAVALVDKLSRHFVTPVTLLDVLDDLSFD